MRNFQATMLVAALLVCQGNLAVAMKANNPQIEALKLKAQKELDSGHFEKADSLFQTAIEDAKKSGANAQLLELISALVRERCAHKKIKTINSFVDTAIQKVRMLKGTREYDPEMSVWMHDLADVLYLHGSQEPDPLVKEYCAGKYVIITCLVHDRVDNLIGSRAQLAITSLEESKKYPEAIQLIEALLAYLQRTSPHDIDKLSNFYYSLGIAYLGANMPDKADIAFKTCLNLDKRVRKSSMHDLRVITIERFAAVCKLEQSKLAEAETLGRTCVNNHAKYISPTHLFTAGDYLVLANILKKEGKIAEAANYYTLGLNAFDTLSKVTGSKDFDAGKAVACEGLAEMDSKLGKLNQTNELRGKVSRLRQIHSNWPAKITDDDAFFFSLWSHFPTPADPIAKIAD